MAERRETYRATETTAPIMRRSQKAGFVVSPDEKEDR